MTSAADKKATLKAIDETMLAGGFASIGSTLRVAGVPFDVVGSYVAGPGSLDLVVVVDATEGTSDQLQRGFWLIERVARALDQAGSRRPLTALILHDDGAKRVPTEDFLRLARVLLVTGENRVPHELAPIMPLVFEKSSGTGQDPMADLLERNRSGKHGSRRAALIEAARHGADHVETTLLEWLDEPFDEQGAPDDTPGT